MWICHKTYIYQSYRINYVGASIARPCGRMQRVVISSETKWSREIYAFPMRYQLIVCWYMFRSTVLQKYGFSCFCPNIKNTLKVCITADPYRLSNQSAMHKNTYWSMNIKDDKRKPFNIYTSHNPTHNRRRNPFNQYLQAANEWPGIISCILVLETAKP